MRTIPDVLTDPRVKEAVAAIGPALGARQKTPPSNFAFPFDYLHATLLPGEHQTWCLLGTHITRLSGGSMRTGAAALRALVSAWRARWTAGRPGLWVVMSALVVLLSTAGAQAQQGAVVLIGNVTDASTGKPVLDAIVTVTSPNLQGEEIAVTDDAGSYRVPGLPPGIYVLRVEKENFKPYAREGLDLHADTTIRLNASLLPESLRAQEVVVVGRTPTVDVGSSSTGMNITSEFTSRIPLAPPGIKGSANRSFESVADVIPGAQPDAYGVSVSGTTSFENRYLLDGLSVSNATYGSLGTPLSIEFIKEISVLSGGYMPEYGRATGGILNAITKSGSNEFHGSAWFNVAPGALEGSRKTAYRDQDSIVTRRRLRHMGDLGADIGGPLIKDKLWFYTGFDFAQTDYAVKRSIRRYLYDDMNQQVLDEAGDPRTQTIPGTTRTYTARQDIYQGIAKLTWAVNNTNRLTLSANGVYPISGGDGQFGVSSLTGQPLLGNEDTVNGKYNTVAHKYLGSSTNAQLKWSSELAGKRVMLDTWLGYHHETGGRLPADGSTLGSNSGLAGVSNTWWHSGTYDLTGFEKVPGTACNAPDADMDGAPDYIPCPVSNYHTGGPEFIEKQDMHRVQGRSILTYLFQGLGHHVMKVGVDSEYQLHNSERAYTGGIDYVDDYYSSGLLVWGRNYGYLEGPDQPVIMDKLRNEAKSLSLGAFVQDSWNVMDEVTLNLGLRYDAQLLYNAQGELAMSLAKQWSPRAGFIWDWTHEGKSKIYGSWARYFENVPLRALDRYLSGEPGLQAAPYADACDSTDPAAQQGACLDPANLYPLGVPPNTRYAPYSTGTSVIDPDLKAPSTDEFVLGTDYEVVQDGRLGINYTNRRLNHTIEDISRDEGTTYFFGNPGYGLARDTPKAQRKYDAVTLQFTKMFSRTWLAQGSYTASWLRGNYSGLYVPETLQADPHQNADFDLEALRVNKYGYLPGDRRHSIKVFAAKGIEIPGAGVFTPGAAFRSNSGAPMSALGRYGLYANAIDVLPRGDAGRLPWVHSIDLRLAYGYNFTKAAGLQFTVDVFNLLNFQQITARDPEYARNQVDPVTDGKGLSSAKASDGSPVIKNPNYRHATAFQAPRIFRFGVKGTF